jgi:surfeit locus 1 family protein
MKHEKTLPLLITFSISFFFLCILGTWQLNKNFINKKNNLLFKEAALNPQKIINFESDIPNLNFVKFKGLELEDKALYLEPRTYKGKIGYHKIVPYKVGDHYVLVNKGFTIDKYKAINQQEDIEGLIIKLPKPKFFELENNFKNNKWYTLNKKDFQNKMKLNLSKYIVYQQNIIKNNNRIAVKPNLVSEVNHLNYAMTWFFLSITLCVIFSIYYNKNF